MAMSFERQQRWVVFAHVPPPVHGQSIMVKHFLSALRELESKVEVVHINAAYSVDGGDVGRIRLGKVVAMIKYIGYALILWRPGSVFYYVPSPVKRSSLVRDWIVLPCIRLFYRQVVLHWHAVGLGAWQAVACGRVTRWWTRYAHGRVDLSLVLSEGNAKDAQALSPKQWLVLPNGIPDPCIDFDSILSARKHALEMRLNAIQGVSQERCVCQILFCSTCIREKGLFDALEIVRRAASLCPQIDWELTVAGGFTATADEVEFQRLAKGADNLHVEIVGEVSGKDKDRLFRKADCFLFPTYYPAEGQPLVVMEAMAWGLPIVTTRWRGIAEMVNESVAWLAEPRALDELASCLVAAVQTDAFDDARRHYLNHYSYDVFKSRVDDVLTAFSE